MNKVKGKKKVINAELRGKIRAAGLYNYDLAEHFDVTVQTICRWLNDESEPTKQKLEQAIEKLAQP